MTGRHHADQDHGDGSDRYGKHSQANANGLSVRTLLERTIAYGDAIRLAWDNEDPNALADGERDLPTAVLPVVPMQVADEAEGDDETEPTTATREARRWLAKNQPEAGTGGGDFVWWPKALAA